MVDVMRRASRWLRARPALDRSLRPLLTPLLSALVLPLVRRLRESGTPGGAATGLRWRLAAALHRVQGRFGLRVTPEDVRWCYRELLGREPESEHAVAAHLHFRDLQSLMDHMARTPEYLARTGHAAVGVSVERGTRAPIVAADFRRSIDNHLRAAAASAELQGYVEVHFERLLHTINVMQDLLPRSAQVLDYSAAGFFTHAVRQLVGDAVQTGVTGVNFELDDYAGRYGEGRYDLCVNTEVLEHLQFDPAHMVLAINRMLKTGGRLLLTTPNAVSMANALKILDGNGPALWNQFKPAHPYYERHNREWTPFEVSRLLQEHGFEVETLYTRDFYASSHTLLAAHGRQVRWLRDNAAHAHFGDTVCVVARKRQTVSAAVRGDWLYA